MDWIDQKIAGMNSPEYREALDAIISLENTADSRIIEPMLIAMGRSGEGECRINRKAGIILSNMQDISLEAWLNALKKDAYTCNDDSWRRYWTAYNLQLCENVRAIKPLVDLLQEPDRYVVEGALISLLQLDKTVGMGDEKRRAVEYLKRVNGVLKRQMGWLGWLRYDKICVAGLIKFALKEWEQ